MLSKHKVKTNQPISHHYLYKFLNEKLTILIHWHIIRNCSMTYMSTGDITCSKVQGTYFTIFLRNPILPVNHLGPGAIQLLREGEEPKSAIGWVRCTWAYSAVQNPHTGRISITDRLHYSHDWFRKMYSHVFISQTYGRPRRSFWSCVTGEDLFFPKFTFYLYASYIVLSWVTYGR